MLPIQDKKALVSEGVDLVAMLYTTFARITMTMGQIYENIKPPVLNGKQPDKSLTAGRCSPVL